MSLSFNASVEVTEVVLRTLENASKDLAKRCILECALRHNFDGDEELRVLGLDNVTVIRKKSDKKPVIKQKPVITDKPKFSLPFLAKAVDENGCNGIAFNEGLYTQCKKVRIENESFCKMCLGESKVSWNGEPNNGTVQRRSNSPYYSYQDSRGRMPPSYQDYMKKRDITEEEVLSEAKKQGLTIPIEHFASFSRSKKMKLKVVKKSKKSVILEEGEEKVDLFENLTDLLEETLEELSDDVVLDEYEQSRINEEKKAEKEAKALEKEAKALEKAQQKAEREANAAQDKTEREAKAAQDKAERESKLALEKAEKAAEREAKKAQEKADREEKLALEKAEKAAEKEAKAALVKAEREAKLALEKAEREAKLAQKSQEKAEREAKLEQEKAEREAKLEQEKAEKAAKLAQEKADKEAKLAEENTARETKLAEEKAEREAKKAQEKADKEAQKSKKSVEKPEETTAPKKVTVKRLFYNGKQYLKSSENMLYDPDTKEEVGIWCEKTQTILDLPDEYYESDEDEN